jgi:hypothetical protein
MVPAERSVTVGVGHGKKAARSIDAWLRGSAVRVTPPREPASFEGLNTWYYEDAPKTVAPRLELVRRQSTFSEVQLGLESSSPPGSAMRSITTTARAAASACRSAPVVPSRWSPSRAERVLAPVPQPA